MDCKVIALQAAILAGVGTAFGYETPADARYPYVSTYYVEPVVSPVSNTVVRFFVTDWENSLERFGDGSFRFDAHLRYTTNRVDWTELSLLDIPSGDHAFELGRLPRGDYLFGLRVVDRKSGLPSHTVWHEFRSRTDEERAVPADRVYTMTAADLTTYGIVPETNRYRYVEVPIDSEMAADETARKNYLAEVARTAEVASGTYAIFSPVYNGKPVLRAFRCSACKYAADYDFDAVEQEAANNVVAIQRLIDDVAAAGFRRLVFLPGKYRLSYLASLEMRNGLDVDLNGAVWKGNGFTGASGCIVNFTHVHDGALRNGTIEGDYYEHDYAGSPSNSEWPLGVCLRGDCRYVALDGLVVSNITGYGVSNGFSDMFPGRAHFNGKNLYSPGCLSLADGTVDTAATNRFTSDFRDISQFGNGYITVSKYLGYQGIATKSWNYVACFYGADKAFISGEVAFQYRVVVIPPGAKYMRISVEEETAEAANGCGMSAQLFKTPWNCVFCNLFIYRCRCVGMAQSAMRNMLVEGCEFSFSGESSATCAYDAEDGWDMMQDVFIRENLFHDNWNAEFLTCAGHNFVVERNRGKIHLYARTNSPCVRDNVCPSATFECGARNRTMHGRYHGNSFEKSLTFGNSSTEEDWFINLSEPIGPEIPTSAGHDSFSLSVSKSGRYRGATIRNTKMQPGTTRFGQTVFTNCHLVLSGTKDGRWTDCTFRNCYWQYSMTNAFTRCVFTDGTHASGMTGRGSTTLTDCVFTNFYIGSGYWTTPYNLTMKGCSVKNAITEHFWSVGVYSIDEFSVEDCRFETGGVEPFHVFDLRSQDTDGEPGSVVIRRSSLDEGVYVSKSTGSKTTAKRMTFASQGNLVADRPVETAEAFMCPLVPGLWTCNILDPESLPAVWPTGSALVYNGHCQTGVTAGVGFTLQNGTGTDAGAYVATATLEKGYFWEDGQLEPRKIDWSIAPVQPVVLSAAATPITYGQTLADSTVTGTVEPAVEGTFVWADASVAPSLADSAKTFYPGTFEPADARNYCPAAFTATVAVAWFSPVLTGTAVAGLDWNGSDVTVDVSNLNLGSLALEDLRAAFTVNGKTYDGTVTARGSDGYRLTFAIDAEGAFGVKAKQAYEGIYSLSLEDDVFGRMDVATGSQMLLQGFPRTETNDWFRETAAGLGKSGAWTRGGMPADLATDERYIHVEPVGGAELDFRPTRAMDEGTKGVIEATFLYEAPYDDDDDPPPGDFQCAARVAEDSETGAVRLQTYAALPEGDGWNVGWHDWNQPAADDFAFVPGTEYAVRIVCDYETGLRKLSCSVKEAGAEDYVTLFVGNLPDVGGKGAPTPRGIASLSLAGTGKVACLDGTYTRDFLDASVAEAGGVRYDTVADAVAAGGPVALLWDASWTPTAGGDYSFVSNGHELKIGGDLVFKVTKNADGTLSVTVGGTAEEPKPATIELRDGKIVIGVANPDPKSSYALARVEKLGDEFVTDESTRKTGEELLSGASLEASVKPGATSEFFKIVVK